MRTHAPWRKHRYLLFFPKEFQKSIVKSAVHKLVKQQVLPYLLKIKPVTLWLIIHWNSESIYPWGSACVSSNFCISWLDLFLLALDPGFWVPWPNQSHDTVEQSAERAVSQHGRGRTMVKFTQQQQDPCLTRDMKGSEASGSLCWCWNSPDGWQGIARIASTEKTMAHSLQLTIICSVA